MSIENYFLKTEQIISDFDIVISQKIEKKKIDDNFGIFKGILYFKESVLDLIEVVRTMVRYIFINTYISEY